MKVVLITQNDSFTIPKNILSIIHAGYNITSIYLISSTNSLSNKKLVFLKWFGFFQASKMFLFIFVLKILDLLDRITFFKVFKINFSIYSVAKKYKIKIFSVPNINDLGVIQHISNDEPDFLVSFSAPQKFGAKLLSIPKKCSLNLHCSLLPDYRGIMPSFWVLHNNESFTGATVHLMGADIDDGKIVLQKNINIVGIHSMFNLIKKTKLVGGYLMVKALSLFDNNIPDCKENDSSKGQYFSWPKDENIKRFKKNGMRLI